MTKRYYFRMILHYTSQYKLTAHNTNLFRYKNEMYEYYDDPQSKVLTK